MQVNLLVCRRRQAIQAAELAMHRCFYQRGQYKSSDDFRALSDRMAKDECAEVSHRQVLHTGTAAASQTCPVLLSVCMCGSDSALHSFN